MRETRYYSERLRIAFEAGRDVRLCYEVVQLRFSDMTERGVADIVSQRGGFDNIRIHLLGEVGVISSQSFGETPGNLGYF
jgi:hypothetical protein